MEWNIGDIDTWRSFSLNRSCPPFSQWRKGRKGDGFIFRTCYLESINVFGSEARSFFATVSIEIFSVHLPPIIFFPPHQKEKGMKFIHEMNRNP
jgi:hypothetical protein